MDQVDKSRRSEERRTGRDTFSECTDLFRDKVTDSVILRSKILHKVLTDSIIFRFGQYSFYIFAAHLSIFQFQGHIDVGQNNSVACRINDQYRITCHIHHFLTFARMIVSHQYNVKSGDILRHTQRSVFIILAGHFESLLPRMEQADHQVRILFFTDDLHPFVCSLLHVVETQSLPQVLREPCRDSRGDHSKDYDFHSVTFHDLIRRKMRFSGRYIDDISS